MQQTGEHLTLNTCEMDKSLEKILPMKNNFNGQTNVNGSFSTGELDKVTTQQRYTNMGNTKSRRKTNSGDQNEKG